MTRAVLLGLLVGLLIQFVILNGIMLFVKDTGRSYSITKSWQQYHSIYNWNLPTNAIADFDGDGVDDLIHVTGCVVLSLVSTDQLDRTTCQLPGSYLGQNRALVGQQVSFAQHSFPWLSQVFVAQQKQEKFVLYDIAGCKVTSYHITEAGIIPRKAELSEYLDACWYQYSHSGLILFNLLTQHLLRWPFS